MQIKLNLIKPSPLPIRKTWDEKKMDELRWSFMEEGQVEPIGLREDGDKYITVWGHRRIEAAKRAGWNAIEAVIVPMDEINNLVQAGVENLGKEDMSIADKADWAFRLTELGLSQREISRRSTIPLATINDWLTWKQEKEGGVEVSGTGHPENNDAVEKTIRIARELGDDLPAKQAVAQKVSTERLGREQTREVARAYRDAPTPAIKEAVLRQPIISTDTAADIIRKSTFRAEVDHGTNLIKELNDFEKEKKERAEAQEYDLAVKDALDFTRLAIEAYRKHAAIVKFNKYTPEAARFAIRKIDTLVNMLQTYREELEKVK